MHGPRGAQNEQRHSRQYGFDGALSAGRPACVPRFEPVVERLRCGLQPSAPPAVGVRGPGEKHLERLDLRA